MLSLWLIESNGGLVLVEMCVCLNVASGVVVGTVLFENLISHPIDCHTQRQIKKAFYHCGVLNQQTDPYWLRCV